MNRICWLDIAPSVYAASQQRFIFQTLFVCSFEHTTMCDKIKKKKINYISTYTHALCCYFSYVCSLPQGLSAFRRSSIIHLFRLCSTAHQLQPHLCVCQCSDLSAAPRVYTKTCTVWPSTCRTNNFIHLHSLSTFLSSFCSFTHFTRDRHQKEVIIWQRAKWTTADNDENHNKSLITGSDSPVD